MKDHEEMKEQVARLCKEVNDLDHGLHKHKDPHWKMWQRTFDEQSKEIAKLKKQQEECRDNPSKHCPHFHKAMINGTKLIEGQAHYDSLMKKVDEQEELEKKYIKEKEAEIARLQGEIRDIKWIADTYDEFDRTMDPECQLYPLAERINSIMAELQEKINRLHEKIEHEKRRVDNVHGRRIAELEEENKDLERQKNAAVVHGDGFQKAWNELNAIVSRIDTEGIEKVIMSKRPLAGFFNDKWFKAWEKFAKRLAQTLTDHIKGKE